MIVPWGGDEPARAARVAHRDHRAATLQPCGLGPIQGRRDPRCPLELEHCDVPGHGVAEDAGRVVAAGSGDEHADVGGAADDVVVRQHLAARGENEARAGGRGLLVAERRLDHDDAAGRLARAGGRCCEHEQQRREDQQAASGVIARKHRRRG